MKKEPKKWITVNGRHVPVYDDKEETPKKFSDHAEEYVGGGVDVDKVFTKEDLDYIKSHQKETDKPLYRVEDMKYTADKLFSDDLDMDDFEFGGSFRSFSRDWNVMGRALDEDSDEYAGIQNPVIFEIVRKKKHFDMEPYTESYAEQFGSQSESLVGGRFQYISDGMKEVNGQFYPVVKIKQL